MACIDGKFSWRGIDLCCRLSDVVYCRGDECPLILLRADITAIKNKTSHYTLGWVPHKVPKRINFMDFCSRIRYRLGTLIVANSVTALKKLEI